MADEKVIPYQSLTNLNLHDCVVEHREIDISWQSSS